MSKLKNAFENGKAFIPFFTGGYPDLDTTKKLILKMQENGADIIELGIPFSDPIAEGTLIQEADMQALSTGCTTDKLFNAIGEIKDEVKIPLVFMTYINVIYKYGKTEFMKKCANCGVCGVIVPDCPYEEKEELMEECIKYGIEFIFTIAPTSQDRIKMIADKSDGFLYCISSLGQTGDNFKAESDIESMVNSIREVSDTPCIVGGGISTPEQAKKIAHYADGVIVGSKILKIISKHGRECIPYVGTYVKEMKDSMNS